MSKLVIIALSVVAVVVIWAWLRRRHVLGVPKVNKPATTLPDVSFPVATETPSGDNTEIALKREQVKPTSASQQPVSTIDKEASQLCDDYQGTETKTSPSRLEVTVPPSDSAMQSTSMDEQCDEEKDPTSTVLTISATESLRAEADLTDCENSKSLLIEAEPTPKPPTYHPPTPPAKKLRTSENQERTPRLTPMGDTDLRLRVQLSFARDGSLKTLALVADRRAGMPSEVDIGGTQNGLRLKELRDDYYEPVAIVDASNALLQGVEWHGYGDSRRWRWVLGGREIYVLAPGDEFGLHGFVLTARLWLNARHVILTKASLREKVLAALTAAGCASWEERDDTTSGVPSGWILFREVKPTRAVPMRDDDTLNVRPSRNRAAFRRRNQTEEKHCSLVFLRIRFTENLWFSGDD